MEDQTIVDGEAGGEAAPVVGAAPQEATPTAAQVSELQEQIKGLISSTSRREGELRQELKEMRDVNELITQFGSDSEEVRDYRAKQKVQGEIEKANSSAAYWQMRAEHPTVPESAYQGATTALEMENAALKYELRNRAETPPVAPVESREPVAPNTLTSGGRGSASLALGTTKEIEAAYIENPNNPEVKAAYLAERRRVGR